ncbi:hypothetical protein Aasi_0729 [Candidatus Amoebophilus asiaticus 5a2]|uniref:Uncharacterized protein n=1 Tax=Amoebophilus asiaticus (strain 5a2) TaxID=452471 RepID=B3ESB0_AMOA5|nr:hypothetical protein [Candidatus Amoebophilus asiaticus]ACE06112.1 hypothetical protein Aasi_0729 [Candidatus Amoebophilus asiaticus 5a2]
MRKTYKNCQNYTVLALISMSLALQSCRIEGNQDIVPAIKQLPTKRLARMQATTDNPGDHKHLSRAVEDIKFSGKRKVEEKQKEVVTEKKKRRTLVEEDIVSDIPVIHKEPSSPGAKQRKRAISISIRKATRKKATNVSFNNIVENQQCFANLLNYLPLKETLHLRQANRYLNKTIVDSKLVVPCAIKRTIDFTELDYTPQTIPTFPFYRLMRSIDQLPRAFWSYLPLTRVEELHLSFMDINDAEIWQLGKYLEYSRIKLLIAMFNNITSKGSTDLGKSLPLWPSIYEVYLKNNLLGDAGAIGISLYLPECHNLKIMDLGSNKIGDKGAAGLGKNIQDSNIENLILTGNQITAEGACELVKNLSKTKVRCLQLGCNPIKNRLGELGRILSTTPVKILGLHGNRIGKKGIMELIQNLAGSNVEELYLVNNDISDSGIKKIAEFLKDTKIYKLDVRVNYIQKKTQLFLTQHYPHVEWVF